MRNYTSTWERETLPLGWTFWRSRLAKVPLPMWGLIAVALAIGVGGVLAGTPKASNPVTDQLRGELALLTAANRDLRGDIELKTLEVERLNLIHYYSTEFKIPADLAMRIHDIALAESVTPELAFNLVRVESGFRRFAVSSVGALGYTQIRPSTARWLDPTVETQNLFDTEANLHLGFRYFRYLLDEYNGDTRLALLAYNRGPGRVGSLLTAGVDPANGYAKRVLGE